ncbi:MAG: hypothetical protein IT452_22760 [Planctomycetia bacterium]|nr:hypothetical protein [Planctomycetia bacterium]
MARGFVIGLFVSSAQTLVVCRLVERRGQAPATATPPPATARDSATASDPDPDLARLKTENDDLRRQIADARAAREAAAVAAKSPAPKAASPWGKIARGLLAFLKQIKEDPKAGQKSQDLFIEMMALMGKIAKERGVSLNEALLTPEGLPALIAGAFEEADPPLSDSERAALDKFAADVAAGWESIQAGKDDRTSLENRREMVLNALGASDAMSGALSAEHAEASRQLQSMGLGMMGSLGMNSHFAQGTPEEIRDNFSKQWAKTLKMDESQAVALAPYVDEYMRAVDAASADFQKDLAAGVQGGESRLLLARLEAQIAAQKKIASSFSLTPAQKKALEGWTTTYVYWGGKAAEMSTDPSGE